MSTRYVWEEFDVVKSYTQQNGTTSGTGTYTANTYTYAGVAAQGFDIDSANGRFSPTGQVLWISANNGYGDASSYPYFFLYPSNAQSSSVRTSIVYMNTQHASSAMWRVTAPSTYDRKVVLTSASSATIEYNFRYSSFQTTYEKGTTSRGKLSAKASSAYPKDGADSDKNSWYVYLGSDSIDPKSVTYSASDTFPGDTITAYVNAASPTYGGTVYYQYSYRVNGGSWTNIGSKITATSITLTVPENAASIQVRVVASDGWGFASTTYVTGSTLSVAGMKCYVGVGGKARQITKMYVGVNGKAREVTAAYVGVNGKARKIF